MALGITLDKTILRADSELFPVIDLVDPPATPAIKIADWLYFRLDDYPITIRLPNRTMKSCPVIVRDIDSPSFTLDTGVTQVTFNFFKNNTSGWVGAYYNTALSSTRCSIEAKAVYLDRSTGISLQNSDVAITDNYFEANAVHSIIFGQGGLASIREKGVLVPYNSNFYYEVGDKAMIELDNGIVRYYHIKPDGIMRLIRATRSKLTAAPKAEVLLYTANAELDEVYVFNNAQASTSIELVAALENFQDWQNEFVWSSTADAIQLANNEYEYTFANSKTRIRSLTPNLNMRQKRDRDDFLDFFLYHGIEKEFLFLDKAHTDRAKHGTEFWAKFTAGFGDKARSSCLSMHGSQIVETFRSDLVAKEIDLGSLEIVLTAPLTAFPGDALLGGVWSMNTNGRLKEFQPYVDGKRYGDMVPYDVNWYQYFQYTIKHSDFAPGVHTTYIVGYNFHGTSQQSATVNFTLS